MKKLVNISKDGAGNYVIPGNLKIKGGLNATKIAADTSIYSAGTIQAEKGLYGGFLNVAGRAEINTGKTAKNDMFLVHHPDGGFFYFNNGPGFGTYNIPNKI